MNSVPASLYKYIPPERAANVLGRLLIRFSQASVMNDIEEFKPPISGVAAEAVFGDKIRERAEALYPGLMELIQKQGPEYVAKLRKQAEQKLPDTIKTVYEMNARNFGILSLSEDATSADMWDRYADQGRGVLVEFDPSHSWFRQEIAEDDDLRQLRRVTYVDDRTPAYLLALTAQDYLYTKERKWEYEKEWRIILNFNGAACNVGKDDKGTDVLLFAIPPDCLTSVTVGYNANREFVEQVRTAIAANPSLSHVLLKAARRQEDGSIEIVDFRVHRAQMIPPPPVQAEFWKKEGFPKFVRFWEVGNRLLDALNKLTLNADVPQDRNESVIRTLCILTGIASADVSMLIAHGHGIGAQKIARTCLEYAINAEYLRLHPTEHRDYLDWSWIEQHRKVNFMRKYMPAEFAALDPVTVADSEKRYLNVKSRFLLPNKKSLRQSWCKLNLRERAMKTDFEEMYGAVYGTASELSHGSFGGLAQHVESIVGDSWQPAIPPSITGCSLALQIVHYCAFRAVQTIVLLKGLESTPPRSSLKSDYDYTWRDENKAAVP